jgi:hypothetical protein
VKKGSLLLPKKTLSPEGELISLGKKITAKGAKIYARVAKATK